MTKIEQKTLQRIEDLTREAREKIRKGWSMESIDEKLVEILEVVRRRLGNGKP